MTETLSWPSRLDLAAKVVALVASLSLAASLLYDWGFYAAVNLSFLEVPSVLSDHVRSGLLWFPKMATSFGAILLFEMVSQRIEKGMTEEEIIQSSPNPQRTKRFREGPQKLSTLSAVLVVIGYVIAGDIFLGVLPFGLCVVWVMFSVWAQSHSRIIERRPIAVRLAIHLLPPISIWLFFTGYNDAVRLYLPTAAASHITVKGGSAPESVVLLRQLDKGVLVREQSKAVGFRPWNNIEKIETPGKYTPKVGVVCGWFGAGCLPASPNMSAEPKEKSNPAVQGTQRDKATQRP